MRHGRVVVNGVDHQGSVAGPVDLVLSGDITDVVERSSGEEDHRAGFLALAVEDEHAHERRGRPEDGSGA